MVYFCTTGVSVSGLMTSNCSLSAIHTVEFTFYFIEKGTRWEGGGNYYINLKNCLGVTIRHYSALFGSQAHSRISATC